jgi:hypothetical protein
VGVGLFYLKTTLLFGLPNTINFFIIAATCLDMFNDVKRVGTRHTIAMLINLPKFMSHNLTKYQVHIVMR